MSTLKKQTFAVFVMVNLIFLIPAPSGAIVKGDKRKARPLNRPLTRAEVKDAEARLSEMGYGTGRVDGAINNSALTAFQKWEGRKVTGRLSRDDFDAIMSAGAPRQEIQVTSMLKWISI